MCDFSLAPIFEKPHCLIKSNDEGTLFINKKVLEQIALLDRGLHIVTIAGLYRTGKSYLLNRLAGINKGFPIGSTTEAKTKGIWVWCRPHPIHENHVLLLMDTEGLGDVEKGDQNNDNWVFALAVLLSSTLVYNILGTFSENYIENLGLVTEMSNYIRTSVSGQNKDDSDFDLFFPMFVLTLRDFSLEMKKGERELTPDEYMEEVCLKLRQGKSERERHYNESRLCIRKYFKTRKCFTFDRPGDREKLKMLEDLSDSVLSKTFCEDSKKFVSFVLSESPPKRLNNGRAINGRMLAIFIKRYVGAIRNESVPCIETAMNVTVEYENKQAVENCVKTYKREMRNSLRLPTPDDQTLSDVHHQCLGKAIEHFLENSFYDKDGRYQKEANAKIMEAYVQCRKNNENKSARCCKQALQDLDAKIQKKLEKNEYFRPGGYKEYMADVNELQDKFVLLDELGCKKEDILLEFLDEKKSERQQVLQADEMMTFEEKRVEEKRGRALTIARVMVDKEHQVQQNEQQHEDMAYQIGENVKLLKEKNRIEMDDQRKHYEEILKKRLAEQKRLQNENFQKNAEQLLKEIDTLEQRIDQMEQKHSNQNKEYFDLEKNIRKETETSDAESCCII